VDETPFNQPPNYFSDKPAHNSPVPLPTQNSGLATASLIVGMVSVVMFCCAPLSTIGFIFSIISGHVSLSTIKKSQGRISGTGFAISGLALGYFGILSTIALVVWSLFSPQPGGGNTFSHLTDPGRIQFDKAEDNLRQLNDGVGSGPTPDEELLSNLLLAKAQAQKSSGIAPFDFSVWCERHGDQVVFLIYSCQLEELKPEVCHQLWAAAIEALNDSQTLPDGSRIAVAFKEYFSFDIALLGTYKTGNVKPESLIEKTLKSDEMDDSFLYPYFKEIEP